jgi:hypothetical protein
LGKNYHFGPGYPTKVLAGEKEKSYWEIVRGGIKTIMLNIIPQVNGKIVCYL